MDPNEYQRQAGRTETDQRAAWNRIMINGPGRAVRLLHATAGISGEAGELSGAVERWLWYGQPLDEDNVKEELGDLLWYIALAARALNVPLGSLMEANLEKLRARFPDKYTDQHALESERDREKEMDELRRSLKYSFQGGDLSRPLRDDDPVHDPLEDDNGGTD